MPTLLSRVALLAVIAPSMLAACEAQQQPTGFYPRPPAWQQAQLQSSAEATPTEPTTTTIAQADEPEPATPTAEPPPPPAVAQEPAATEPAATGPATSTGSSSSTPARRTQWVCNATGWWQKCDASFHCFAQSTMMLGFGSTESLARGSAEALCNNAMSRLMSVNFTYRTSVTQRCKAISCSPPNAE